MNIDEKRERIKTMLKEIEKSEHKLYTEIFPAKQLISASDGTDLMNSLITLEEGQVSINDLVYEYAISDYVKRIKQDRELKHNFTSLLICMEILCGVMNEKLGNRNVKFTDSIELKKLLKSISSIKDEFLLYYKGKRENDFRLKYKFYNIGISENLYGQKVFYFAGTSLEVFNLLKLINKEDLPYEFIRNFGIVISKVSRSHELIKFHWNIERIKKPKSTFLRLEFILKNDSLTKKRFEPLNKFED